MTRFQKALFTVVLATVAALAAAGLSGGLYVHLETLSATQARKQDAADPRFPRQVRVHRERGR